MKSFLIAVALMLACVISAEEIDLSQVKIRPSIGTAEIVQDANGKSAFVLKGLPTTPDNPKNRYLVAIINLPKPIDMTNKDLKIKVTSSTPELINGFFVRGYNRGVSGQYPLAWSMVSTKKMLQTKPREIQLIPGHSWGGMRWRAEQVNNTEPTAINRLQIFLATFSKDKDVDVRLEDLRVEDSPINDLKAFFAPVGELQSFDCNGYTQNPIVDMENEDGAIAMKISSVAPVKSLRKALYESVIFKFEKPFSMKDRPLSFQIKLSPQVTMVFFRAYNANNTEKQSEVAYSLYCNRITRDTWTPITLGLMPSRVDVKQLNGKTPDQINRLEIIFSTGILEKDFEIGLKDMKLLDATAQPAQ